MSFKKNKYQVIRGAISKDLADVAYRYLQIRRNKDGMIDTIMPPWYEKVKDKYV